MFAIKNMKEKISRVSLVIYVVLFLASFLLLSCPGDNVVWFCIMGAFSIPPLIVGPRKYRILGIIAFVLTIVLITADYIAGKLF